MVGDRAPAGGCTLPETAMTPELGYCIPKGNDRIPTFHFSGANPLLEFGDGKKMFQKVDQKLPITDPMGRKVIFIYIYLDVQGLSWGAWKF